MRGNYTADVLWNIGVKNVRVIGCPTLFRHRNPDHRIDLPKLEKVRKVGYTLRREVDPAYAPDITRYLKVQRDTLLALAKRSEVTVFAQGEIEEKKVVIGTPEQREEAIAKLIESGWFTGQDDPLAEALPRAAVLLRRRRRVRRGCQAPAARARLPAARQPDLARQRRAVDLLHL